jgi:nitronate monooxygenase
LASDVRYSEASSACRTVTSLGAVRDVVDAIHSYGGLVFDIINLHHARKTADAGVDG